VGLYGLLSSFNKILVTVSRANYKSFNTLLDYFKFPEEEKKKYLHKFVNETAEFGYWSFDPRTRKVTRHVMDDDNKKKPKDIEQFFHLFPNPSQTEALYNLIFSALPSNIIDKKDHSILLKSTDGKKCVRISVFDYLHYLSSQTRPPKPIRQMHNYVRRKLTLAKVFNKNPHLN